MAILYLSEMDAFNAFISNNWDKYLDKDHNNLDVDEMTNDFQDQVRTTNGGLYYLEYEGG